MPIPESTLALLCRAQLSTESAEPAKVNSRKSLATLEDVVAARQLWHQQHGPNVLFPGSVKPCSEKHYYIDR